MTLAPSPSKISNREEGGKSSESTGNAAPQQTRPRATAATEAPRRSGFEAQRTGKDLHADRQASGGLTVDVEQHGGRARRVHAPRSHDPSPRGFDVRPIVE